MPSKDKITKPESNTPATSNPENTQNDSPPAADPAASKNEQTNPEKPLTEDQKKKKQRLAVADRDGEIDLSTFIANSSEVRGYRESGFRRWIQKQQGVKPRMKLKEWQELFEKFQKA